MISYGARFALFLCSYAPLSLIFFVLYFTHSILIAIVSMGCLVVGLISPYWIFHNAMKLQPIPAQVSSSRKQGSDLMAYVATYLLPFVGFPLDDWSHRIALSIFFLMLSCLYVRTDLIHVNPTLEFLGFHVFEVTFEPGTVRRLVTRRPNLPEPGESIRVVSLNDDLYVERSIN